MARGVHGQRGDELSEAVDEEPGAVVERAERRQILVRALEARHLEHLAPLGGTAAAGSQGKAQHEGEREGGERERPRRHPKQSRGERHGAREARDRHRQQRIDLRAPVRR